MDNQFNKQQLSIVKTVGLFLLSGTRASCYTYALLFLFLGLLLANTRKFPLEKFFNLSPGILISVHFCKAAQKCKERPLPPEKARNYNTVANPLTSEPLKENNTFINTSGDYIGSNSGTVVKRDLFNFQNCKININQDIAEIAEQLKPTITRLQEQGKSLERIQAELINAIKDQARENSNLQAKLLERASKLKGFSVEVDTGVAAETFVRKVFSYSYSRGGFHNRIEVAGDPKTYEALDRLLQNRQWVEADVETARAIFKLRSKDFDARNSYGITKLNRYKLEPRDIEELYIDDLKRINSLWVNASNGRFGFSVQRQLWEESHQDTSNELESFGKTVGWRGVDGWIYYSDLSNLSSDRKGAFPAIVVMSRSTNRPLSCKPNISLLRVLMKRAYTL